MVKVDFNYLYSFKYNKKDYIFLTSRKYPFYFLEYNSSSKRFTYPDIDSFKSLYNNFFNNNHYTFDNLKSIKNKLNKMNINITPLVRTINGLISISVALSMCGCQQTNNNSSTEIIESSISEINNVDFEDTTYNRDKYQEISDYFNQYDMHVTNREYDGNDYIFVDEFINKHNKHQITLKNFDEFRKYKNINFIPTWDDVIEAFKNNSNIHDKEKEMILDGINNMRNTEELKDLDLSILYINAQKMNFQYISSQEISDTTNRETAYAYFDATTGTVYLPNDKDIEKFIFMHEVLGHGSLAFTEEKENYLVVFNGTNYIMLPDDGRYTGYSMGIVVSEGGANMIAHFITNDYSQSNFYELYEEELRVIADLCGVSIGELLNHKGYSLYDLMYENNINTPVEYIFKMDSIFKGQMYIEFSDLMERLFVDATVEEYLNADKNKQKEIIDATVAIIRDSYFQNKNELNHSYNLNDNSEGSIVYSFDDAVSRYEENMYQLKN